MFMYFGLGPFNSFDYHITNVISIEIRDIGTSLVHFSRVEVVKKKIGMIPLS